MYILHSYIIYTLQHFARRSRGLSAQLAHFQGEGQGNKAHTVVGMSVGAARGAHIYLQGAWVAARLWPGFPGRGCVGGSCAGASLSRCCGLAASRRVVALSRWAPLAWVAGTGLPRRRVRVRRGGACAVSVARWCLDGGMRDLGGGQMACCKKKGCYLRTRT